jgi:hypothetical protein
MGRVVITHTLDVTPKEYWRRCLLSESFNEEYFVKGLGFRAYEVVESRQEGDLHHRKIRTVPKVEPPRVIQKAIGGEIAYIEEGVFDGNTYTFSIKPSVMSEKILINGSFTAEPVGENQMKRIATMDIRVRIFGIGKAIETFIEQSTRDNFNSGISFIREFLARPESE